jgi:primosomal protein N' (replication factor Y)
VQVPFGRGDTSRIGFVLGPGQAPAGRKLKTVAEVLDTEPQFDDAAWALAEWVSQYYLSPLGMVLGAMVPSAVGRHAPRTETVAFLLAERDDWPGRLGTKQKTVLDELIEARAQGIEPVSVELLTRHADAGRDTIRRLAGRGLIRLHTRPQTLETLAGHPEADPFDLNADQRAVLEAVEARLDAGFSVSLLQGVTGSGKTEVYIRAIRRVVEAGRQAILLVPEIALATQTLDRLAARLPRVAVLHSGLTSAQRAFYFRQIRDGHAAVVIGPRSAVFAPTRRLGLIVVDEEHEGTYKQDAVPRYHGRDVAVKRAAMAGVPVLLGSATPSLESLHNARQGRYELLRLPHRIRGLPMPRLELIELRKDVDGGRIELIGRTLENRLADRLDRGEQAILLMNRRGYASFVFCPSCEWSFECEDCSRTMVYHQAVGTAKCHYCGLAAAVPAACPACGRKLVLFGLGIQRIESELARKFPNAAVARMDSDTMTSPAQFTRVFKAFAAGEVDILLGTQMVAKGLDFPKVTLVGVASADTALSIPDFRAAERTFQLVVQVAGRAGRGDRPGEVIVQTLFPDDPAIGYALNHDYDGFADYELPLRQEAGLPPAARMVRFTTRSADATRAETAARKLRNELVGLLRPVPGVEIVGPMRAGVFRIRKQFRFQIDCLFPRPGAVQAALAPKMPDLAGHLGAELVVDVDPTTLA